MEIRYSNVSHYNVKMFIYSETYRQASKVLCTSVDCVKVHCKMRAPCKDDE